FAWAVRIEILGHRIKLFSIRLTGKSHVTLFRPNAKSIPNWTRRRLRAVLLVIVICFEKAPNPTLSKCSGIQCSPDQRKAFQAKKNPGLICARYPVP
ncbi:hypothetical protein WG66_009729, partial [Moniliophthora roreri]